MKSKGRIDQGRFEGRKLSERLKEWRKNARETERVHEGSERD